MIRKYTAEDISDSFEPWPEVPNLRGRSTVLPPPASVLAPADPRSPNASLELGDSELSGRQTRRTATTDSPYA